MRMKSAMFNSFVRFILTTKQVCTCMHIMCIIIQLYICRMFTIFYTNHTYDKWSFQIFTPWWLWKRPCLFTKGEEVCKFWYLNKHVHVGPVHICSRYRYPVHLFSEQVLGTHAFRLRDQWIVLRYHSVQICNRHDSRAAQFDFNVLHCATWKP